MIQHHIRTLCFTILGLFTFQIQISGQELYVPRVSPKASVSQYIGVCNVTVDYGRPGARERKIFGNLVPYDKVWRAGANEATTISFSHPVLLGGKEVSSGTYGLFMIPGRDTWTVILNLEWNQWGAYHYDNQKDAVRIKVSPQTIDHTEMFTYSFSEVNKSNGILKLEWETTRIGIPIETNSHAQTLEEIERSVNNSRAYWYTYSAAAQYHYYEREEVEIAMKYIDIAITLEAPNPAPWMLKSQILASLGRFKEAVDVAEAAISVCKKQDFPFEIHENEDNIRKWKGMIKD